MRPYVHDHDDATPSLLMRNLPPDVTCAELVTLITKHTSCRYRKHLLSYWYCLSTIDLIIPLPQL